MAFLELGFQAKTWRWETAADIHTDPFLPVTPASKDAAQEKGEGGQWVFHLAVSFGAGQLWAARPNAHDAICVRAQVPQRFLWKPALPELL